jgi:hypothetical protein
MFSDKVHKLLEPTMAPFENPPHPWPSPGRRNIEGNSQISRYNGIIYEKKE